MTDATICKQFRFSAHHRLPDHQGKCANDHGHNYLVEVYLSGPIQIVPGENDNGMVVDFGAVSDFWKQHLDPELDHRSLNEVLPNPTAELLAKHILARLRASGPRFGHLVSRVRVWETDTAWAEVPA